MAGLHTVADFVKFSPKVEFSFLNSNFDLPITVFVSLLLKATDGH